jgi:transcriptional regulator with XRE-family HTH domain
MKLAAWLKEREMSQQAFADKAGVSQGTIARFVLGQRMPNKLTMRKIFDATEGQVTANDFHDVSHPQDAAPCPPII